MIGKTLAAAGCGLFALGRMGVFGVNSFTMTDTRTEVPEMAGDTDNFFDVEVTRTPLWDTLSYWVDGRLPCFFVTKRYWRPVEVTHYTQDEGTKHYGFHAK
jgi:hypothetical protein